MRLARRRFLRGKRHFAAFFESYKICNLLHRSNLAISKFKQNWKFRETFSDFAQNSEKIAIFQSFSSNFAQILIKISRNFAEYSKKWWAIPKMLNFQWILADFSWIPTEFWPNFDVKNSIYSIARQSNLSTLAKTQPSAAAALAARVASAATSADG